VPEPHNPDHGPQGPFRTGALDAVLLRYALDVCPVDALAVTCLDRVPPTVPVCPRYVTEGPPDLTAAGRLLPGPPADLTHRERLGAWLRTVTPELVQADPVVWVEEHLAPVWLTSRGPTAGGKGWRG
jgi:adenylosuccinate synthase